MLATNFKISSPFTPAGDQPTAIKALIDGVRHNYNKQILLGVTGSGKTFTIAHLIEELKRPTLIMAPNKTLAAQLYGEFKAFFPKNAVEYFVSYYDYYQPEAYVVSSDTFIEKDSSINEHIEQMRLSATKALLERQDVIIVATVSAIYGLGDPNSYLSMVLHVSCQEICEPKKILQRLVDMQYTRTNSDLMRGQFRVNGDILDIFPADEEKAAIRIEFFDNEIIAIVAFDPITGKKTKTLPRITIFPKTHYVTPREKILDAIDKIKQELKSRLNILHKENRLVEAQRLETRTIHDLEMMLEIGYCSGIENYSRHLSGRDEGEPPPTLFDYLPEDALLVIDESHVTVPQIGGMYNGDRARKTTLVEYGFRLPSALDNRPLRFEEFENRGLQTIYVSATPGKYEIEHVEQVVEQLVRPTGLIDPEVIIRPVATQVEDLLKEIKKVSLQNNRVLVTTLTKRMAEDLTTYLQEQHIKVRYLHADIDTVERVEIIRDLRLGIFDVLIGINLLREGLDIPEVALVAILDADKEGFLRSKGSLIQTIGRAARNVAGYAILYADKITNSIQQALDETKRRRDKQIAFNKLHNITPKGIQKNIADILPTEKTIEEDVILEPSNSSIAELEAQMQMYANNLEFEKAAIIRDMLSKAKI